MTGTARAQPLHPGDPVRLGRYRIVGRLGQGGMGTVYLADDGGRLVAVKVIRADVAANEEFRRRFRGEVERARQVPPFCTAEVLDADADHEHPYLVVEYVDGPSLSTVVAERGPLSPANLHALAIGMATALTAIHGAGVIHRDLKPSNVLLAPGSPKVIDFGIARAVDATSRHTRTNQVLGTVGYMAPERFGPDAAKLLSPAADVFAWGAVLAYAGTGRPPFGVDSPPVVATRIVTQAPDLGGLVAPLRDLVERALAKDPADRPTSRQLLDLLLAPGRARQPAVAAALAEQPALLVAAEEAQATSDTTRLAGGTPAAAPGAPARTRVGWGRLANVALAVAVLVTSLTVAAIATGMLPLADRDGSGGTPTPSTGAATSLSTTPPATATAAASPTQPVIRDPLTAPGPWERREDEGQRTTCGFAGGLVVTRESAGSYRCPGPTGVYTDVAAAVDVRLQTPGSCAALWFRFAERSGYLLRVCADAVHLATHGVGDGATVRVLRTMPFDEPLPLDTATRIRVTAQGQTITVERDGERIGGVDDSTFTRGRVVLGIFADAAGPEPPFRVAFTDVEIRALTG